ncbi:hypothetical protein [Motiliproteus sp. MSK22-1]|uniref:hypothetical protein n=1 Tax=Motiliproteus sp. MSK22-1 TaxID=1897630 RepID=UPI000977AB16|nr:hypothetical protein [Motiliproteus sp. MSK22-1]OMH28120.1 hypothetical protein BGP75_22420 [Motiliproteus sp. MSK22-1]
MLTNTHFIKDLELVEGALYDLEKISQLEGVDLTNMIRLIRDRLGMALPDVVNGLRIDDVLEAHKKGLLNWPEDGKAILKGEKSIEEFFKK